MKKDKKYKTNFYRYPSNNKLKMLGNPMHRHCGGKHLEKWRSKFLPF